MALLSLANLTNLIRVNVLTHPVEYNKSKQKTKQKKNKFKSLTGNLDKN